MYTRLSISNQNGFTLIELISIMIILGVLATVVTKRFDILSDTASQRALVAGISELNARERLTWTNIKMSPAGWTNDTDVFNAVNKNLGKDYVWTAAPNALGGTLSFGSESKILIRTASTNPSWGKWN